MKTYRYSVKLSGGISWDTLYNDYISLSTLSYILNHRSIIDYLCIFRKIKTWNRYKVRIVPSKKIHHCFQTVHGVASSIIGGTYSYIRLLHN